MAEDTYDHVFIDNVAAARQATDHLLSLGRRRVAAIGQQPESSTRTAQFRVEGYRQALAAAGAVADPRLLVATDAFHRQEGFTAMRHLRALPDRPDAVFCFNDLLAIGAIRAILLAGLRVPEDIMVIGFDGIEEGGYSTPTISTVAPDMGMIAALAVEQVLARIEGNQDTPAALKAPFTLIPRESTLGRGASPLPVAGLR